MQTLKWSRWVLTAAAGSWRTTSPPCRAGDDFARFLAEAVRWTTAEAGDEVEGREPVRDHIVALHAQALDAHAEVNKLVVDDGAAVLEVDLVGTHTGDLAGTPTTGASIRVP